MVSVSTNGLLYTRLVILRLTSLIHHGNKIHLYTRYFVNANSFLRKIPYHGRSIIIIIIIIIIIAVIIIAIIIAVIVIQ